MSDLKCFAFVHNDGTIDIDSLGDSEDDVRRKVLEDSLGWRYEHPDRWSHDEEWQRLLLFGSVRAVVVSLESTK